jgi:iron(III) transport system substrate-binding protein
MPRARLRRFGTVCAALACAAAGLAGCGARSASGGPVTLTLYNGQHPQTTQALVAAFERRTGIVVKEHDGDEDQLAAEIEEEGPATPADVFYSENSPALMSLEGKGLLEKLPASILGRVPARYDSPAGDWVGVSARVSVMVYNKSLLRASELPRSVLDLAEPLWKGKLALAPTDTDILPVITSVARAVGQDRAVRWLKAIDANASNDIEPDNEAVTAAVNDGRAALGIIDQYYWYRLRAEIGRQAMHSRIAYFAPGDPGYVLDVSGVGVLSSSRHLAAAEQLAAFLVSATGQELIAHSDSFEYPLVPGVAPAPGLVPLADLHPAPVGIAQLGDGTLAVQLEQEAQVI